MFVLANFAAISSAIFSFWCMWTSKWVTNVRSTCTFIWTFIIHPLIHIYQKKKKIGLAKIASVNPWLFNVCKLNVELPFFLMWCMDWNEEFNQRLHWMKLGFVLLHFNIQIYSTHYRWIKLSSRGLQYFSGKRTCMVGNVRVIKLCECVTRQCVHVVTASHCGRRESVTTEISSRSSSCWIFKHFNYRTMSWCLTGNRSNNVQQQ